MLYSALNDENDLINFIIGNYKKTKKIIEIGVGSYPWIAKKLKDNLPETNIVVTDINKEKLTQIKSMCPTLNIVHDDLFQSNIEIFEGSSLLYSIRPPPELIPKILEIAFKVDCDVLIRPLGHEECNFNFLKKNGWQSIWYGKTFFFLLRKKI